VALFAPISAGSRLDRLVAEGRVSSPNTPWVDPDPVAADRATSPRAQEEALVARGAEVGDELGSAVTAARLVRDMMRLALLLERRYAPYQKWLGTAFAHGSHPDDLPRHLSAVMHAADPRLRAAALAEAWSALARRHNDAGMTVSVDPSLRNSTPGRIEC